ncbi:MAG: YkgJ family cysteine cluster protein [Candidatus Diapherotrites archaeon]
MPFECLSCLECCNRYWISVLPSELRREAKSLHLSEKSFTDKFCVLFLELYHGSFRSDALVVSSKNFPKKISKKIKKELGVLPESFLALPFFSFRRKGRKCIFLKSKKCLIHEVKPMQCFLFPFIELEQKMKGKPLDELYPFCRGLGENLETDVAFKALGEKHYNRVKVYFESIKKKGFKKVWRHWPAKGVLALEGKVLCELSGKDFFSLISLFA